VADIEAVKRQQGVPGNVSACHTAKVEGYLIEGHVPADAIDRLLAERPDVAGVAGIAVPGMPPGSPGMAPPGHEGNYEVVTFKKDGSAAVYERR
jgi:hypothetical protein